MLIYVSGSLFESPAQTLVNTVNTVGVMGKGIALTFKRLYPQMFEQYRQFCREGKLEIGKLYVYRTPNKIIVNFPTKKHWRNPSKVEYIEAGLKKFVTSYGEYGISSVSFPQLGCGHGELDWETQVRPLMEKYLRNLPIPVYIHLYPKAADFVPERLDRAYARQVQMERYRHSFADIWHDLQTLVSDGQTRPDRFTPREPAPQAQIDDEFLTIQSATGSPVSIAREDLEDLWNVLRLRGTLREDDVPVSIRQTNITKDLFALLAQLQYVKPVDLYVKPVGHQPHGAPSLERGLRYVPPAMSQQVPERTELRM